MKQYYGIIELGTIENVGENANQIDLITAQFVHYPDCQQLTIWLPQYGRQGYGNIRLINNRTKAIIDDKPVADRLNGSVQILWDTLEIAPSDYTIEIEHPKGGKHILPFKKYAKGKKINKENPLLLPKQQQETPSLHDRDASTLWKTYTDGFGNTLPNEDLILREQVTKQLIAQFTRRIEYEGSFRAGYIIYIEGDLRLKFSHEMGGGNCKFYIDVPTESTWEVTTKTPLSKREDIVAFVARAVQSDHASNWQYEIREDSIYYY